MQNKFTVCVLLYGDFPDLAIRCLEPIFKLQQLGLCELRIGMNEVSQTTADYIQQNAGNALLFSANPQIYKYPMMKKMFYDIPLNSDYVMWFDDDSFIHEENVEKFLSEVEEAMKGCDMMGSLYCASYAPSQITWCKSQPWYKGKPISDQIKFAVGGWQCIKTEVITRFGWPLDDLRHCGGDVTLGVLFEQNDLVMKQYNKGVSINADESGKESTAARRGASHIELPVGFGKEVLMHPSLLIKYLKTRLTFFLCKLIGIKM